MEKTLEKCFHNIQKKSEPAVQLLTIKSKIDKKLAKY